MKEDKLIFVCIILSAFFITMIYAMLVWMKGASILHTLEIRERACGELVSTAVCFGLLEPEPAK